MSSSVEDTRRLFAGRRFAILTRLEQEQTVTTLILVRSQIPLQTLHARKFGGACVRAPTVDDAAISIGLADESKLHLVDSQLLRAFAGRVHRSRLITDSVRRKQVQALESYTIHTPPTAATRQKESSPPAIAPLIAAGTYSHTTKAVVAHSSTAPDLHTDSRASSKPRRSSSPSAGVATTAASAAVVPAAPVPSSPSPAPASPVPSTASRSSSRKRLLDDRPDEPSSASRSASKRFRSLPPTTLAAAYAAHTVSTMLSQADDRPEGAPPVASPTTLAAPAAATASALPPSPTPASSTFVLSLLAEKRRRSHPSRPAPALLSASPMSVSPPPSPKPTLERQAEVITVDDDGDGEDATPGEDIEIPASEEQVEPDGTPAAAAVEEEKCSNDDDVEDEAGSRHRQHQIDAAVGHLESAGFSRALILHALLVTSGHLGRARQYLLHRLPEKVHCWTPQEDRVLGGASRARTQQLIRERGAELVSERIAFLHATQTT